MPSCLYNFGIKTSVYLINRLSTSMLNGLTLVKSLFKVSPQYNTPKVFGCSCFLLSEISINTFSNSNLLNALSLVTASIIEAVSV